MAAQAWSSAFAHGGQTAMWAAAAAEVQARLCAMPVVGAALQRPLQPSCMLRGHRTPQGRSFGEVPTLGAASRTGSWTITNRPAVVAKHCTIGFAITLADTCSAAIVLMMTFSAVMCSLQLQHAVGRSVSTTTAGAKFSAVLLCLQIMSQQ